MKSYHRPIPAIPISEAGSASKEIHAASFERVADVKRASDIMEVLIMTS